MRALSLVVALSFVAGSRYTIGWYSAWLNSLAAASVVFFALFGRIMQRHDRRGQRSQQRADVRKDTLLVSEARFRAIFARSPFGIALLELEGRIVESNATFQAMLGRSEDHLVGHLLTDFAATDHASPSSPALVSWLLPQHDHVRHERQYVRGDGVAIWVDETMSLVPEEGDQPRFLFAMMEDISDRKARQAALEHQAHYDALTDLPNRSLLADRLRDDIAETIREGAGLALLLLNLDGFKEINSTLGHAVGDLLLPQVGQRVGGLLRDVDFLACLGGDMFAVVLPRMTEAGATRTARRILQALEEPFMVERQRLPLSGSIGIALAPNHAVDVQALLRKADVAVYLAKRGRLGCVPYRPQDDPYRSDRLAVLADLRRAVIRDELVLYYQPQADLATGCIRGVEALVRWRHPSRGIVPPDQFIPLAEQTGLIESITDWVLERALCQSRVWRTAGVPLTMAVNLSARSLVEPTLIDRVSRQLWSQEVAPSSLILEITESAVMSDPVRSLETLARISELGVKLAIDDFGTGYSSLAYLTRMPVHDVKIDKSFVLTMMDNESDAAIVRSTVDLAHNLGLTVTAEGVETQAVCDRLRALGCDAIQGYFLSRPVPAPDLFRWWRSRRDVSLDS